MLRPRRGRFGGLDSLRGQFGGRGRGRSVINRKGQMSGGFSGLSADQRQRRQERQRQQRFVAPGTGTVVPVFQPQPQPQYSPMDEGLLARLRDLRDRQGPLPTSPGQLPMPTPGGRNPLEPDGFGNTPFGNLPRFPGVGTPSIPPAPVGGRMAPPGTQMADGTIAGPLPDVLPGDPTGGLPPIMGSPGGPALPPIMGSPGGPVAGGAPPGTFDNPGAPGGGNPLAGFTPHMAVYNLPEMTPEQSEAYNKQRSDEIDYFKRTGQLMPKPNMPDGPVPMIQGNTGLSGSPGGPQILGAPPGTFDNPGAPGGGINYGGQMSTPPPPGFYGPPGGPVAGGMPQGPQRSPFQQMRQRFGERFGGGFGGRNMGRPMSPYGGPSMGRPMNPPMTPQQPYGFGPYINSMNTSPPPGQALSGIQPMPPVQGPGGQMSQGLPPNISTGFGFPSPGMQQPQMGQTGQMGQQQPPQQGNQMQAGGPSGGGAPTLF